ncbi:hypothetical protein ACPV5U_19620 [Vibrio mediterranei]
MKFYKPISTFRELKAAIHQLETSGAIDPDNPLTVGGEPCCLFVEHGERTIKLDATSVLDDIDPSRLDVMEAIEFKAQIPHPFEGIVITFEFPEDGNINEILDVLTINQLVVTSVDAERQSELGFSTFKALDENNVQLVLNSDLEHTPRYTNPIGANDLENPEQLTYTMNVAFASTVSRQWDVHAINLWVLGKGLPITVINE